jgi:hypothetical protein
MRPRATSALILALAAGFAAGCGSDDDEGGEPIPAEQAAALQRQLDSIENRFQFAGSACADITGNADPNTTAVSSVIDSLPENVDPDVRSSLEQSFDRLFQLVEEQCDTEKGQEEEQQPATPVEPEPETTQTIPPEDEAEDDEGEETPPPTEEVPTTEEPPVEEVPPEVPQGEGGDGESGEGGSGGSGQGGSGATDQGEGGGAIVPEAGQ